MVTHLTTDPSVLCLNMAERTGNLAVSAMIDRLAFNMTASGIQRPVNDSS